MRARACVLPVDPGVQGDARELEHRDEVLGSGVVRLGADLAQGLLEREDELERRGRSRRPPPRRCVTTGTPSGSWGRPGTPARSDPPGWPRDRFDREAASIGCPHEPHAIHVGVGERPVLDRARRSRARRAARRKRRARPPARPARSGRAQSRWAHDMPQPTMARLIYRRGEEAGPERRQPFASGSPAALS